MKPAKINKKRLLKSIEFSGDETEKTYSMEHVARAYLYLGDVGKYYFYMNKAIILNMNFYK